MAGDVLQSAPPAPDPEVRVRVKQLQQQVTQILGKYLRKLQSSKVHRLIDRLKLLLLVFLKVIIIIHVVVIQQEVSQLQD